MCFSITQWYFYQKHDFCQIFLSESLVFCEQKREWVICSKKQAICSFAHLSWVTWDKGSQSLICPEWSERITHIHSFDLSKWTNSQPWSPQVYVTAWLSPSTGRCFDTSGIGEGRFSHLAVMIHPSQFKHLCKKLAQCPTLKKIISKFYFELW